MFDILSFCRNYGIPYAMQGKNIGPGWLGMNCPFHRDEAYHLGFNIAGAYFYCWKCGGHSVHRIIKGYLRCSDFEAQTIEDEYGTRNSLLAGLNKRTPQADTLVMPGEELSKLYRKYLIKRGLDPDEIIEKYHVKAGGIVGGWKYRLMIPVYENGTLMTYQGRDITGNTDLRYKTLSIEESVDNPKHLLYNIDNTKKDAVIVCEGVVDVWKIGDGSVATLGTSTTEEQVRKLNKFGKVYILFDPEENAQKRAKKLGERVAAMGTEVEIIDTGLDHDPGDMTPKEVETLRRELEF